MKRMKAPKGLKANSPLRAKNAHGRRRTKTPTNGGSNNDWWFMM